MINGSEKEVRINERSLQTIIEFTSNLKLGINPPKMDINIPIYIPTYNKYNNNNNNNSINSINSSMNDNIDNNSHYKIHTLRLTTSGGICHNQVASCLKDFFKGSLFITTN